MNHKKTGGSGLTAEARADAEALLITHVDNTGITRAKIVPGDRIESAAKNGASVSLSLGMLYSVDDFVSATDDIDPIMGDLKAIPDLERLRSLDADRGLLWAPANLHLPEGPAHPTCQRSLLASVEDQAASAGLDFLVGLELEFTLYRFVDGEAVLSHRGPAYGAAVFLELEDWSLDLLAALREAEVPLEQLHPEYADGQIEIAFAPLPPVEAADNFVLARQIITRVSLRHGFRASFAPVSEIEGLANGFHIHVSASRDGQNVFFDDDAERGFGEEGAHLLAGVLDHLAASLMLLGGSVLSFERLQPSHWSGAYACWGDGNREVAVRFIRGRASDQGKQANIEVKCADPAANPYLAIAALIGSALDGLEKATKLPEAVQVNPVDLDGKSRRRARAVRFPENLGEVIKIFKASTFHRELLGKMAFEARLVVAQHEWETYGPMDKAWVADAVRFRY